MPGEKSSSDRGGIASQPVCANSPTNRLVITTIAPAAVIQKLKLLRNGKLTSRAPIWSGTTKFISPVTIGMATKKIMMTPWAVNTWS